MNCYNVELNRIRYVANLLDITVRMSEERIFFSDMRVISRNPGQREYLHLPSVLNRTEYSLNTT